MTDVCPITCEDIDSIEEKYKFEVKQNGTTVQTYNLVALSDWLTLKPFYPHSMEHPTPEDIKELEKRNETLNRVFVYVKNKGVPPNYFTHVSSMVSSFKDIQIRSGVHDLQLNLHKIFTIYFDKLNFQNSVVFYFGKESTQWNVVKGINLFGKQSLYQKCNTILLHKIYIDNTNEIYCDFSINTMDNKKRTLYCSFNAQDIPRMLANPQTIRDNTNFTFMYKCKEPKIDETIIANQEKLVYYNKAGELVFDKTKSNGFNECMPAAQGGGKAKYTFKGKQYKVHVGKRGGKYIVVNREKKYINI